MSAPKRKKMKGQLRRIANAHATSPGWRPSARIRKLARRCGIRLGAYNWRPNRWNYK